MEKTADKLNVHPKGCGCSTHLQWSELFNQLVQAKRDGNVQRQKELKAKLEELNDSLD